MLFFQNIINIQNNYEGREKERLSGVSMTNYLLPRNLTRYPVVKIYKYKNASCIYMYKRGFHVYLNKFETSLYIYF